MWSTSRSTRRRSARPRCPTAPTRPCAGLRIIDGNAEAYRLDAMRRAGS
ncbi:hypothetical protein G4G28_07945 [Massilia sp. Dwa41.01b]|nr:hypothetical protein [Massilia sp. Dwa41.01b]QNA88439.1 hypothetical protein G4G28_07945 [Massilia sp. Dwa41.01b]